MFLLGKTWCIEQNGDSHVFIIKFNYHKWPVNLNGLTVIKFWNVWSNRPSVNAITNTVYEIPHNAAICQFMWSVSARGVNKVLSYTVTNNTNCHHINSYDIAFYKMARVGISSNLKRDLQSTLIKLVKSKFQVSSSLVEVYKLIGHI